MIKSPKLYFYDTGLLCHVLGIRQSDQLLSHPLRGAIFENYIIAEAYKTYAHHRRTPPLSFWRDQTGHEIDLIIEEAGQLYAVEIKSGQTIAKDMFKNLQWWLNLTNQPANCATLVYAGTEHQVRQGIAVCPWYSI